MKFRLEGAYVVAQAETTEESVALLSLAEKKASTQKTEVKKTDKKPKGNRKKNYKRTCPICKKEVKGLLGLGVHARMMHDLSNDELEKEVERLAELREAKSWTPLASLKRK